MSHRFGKKFQVTVFGESHGPFVGCLIEGCPPNIQISEEEIYLELKQRAPGKEFATKRNEKDLPQIISGVFKGYTTGMPICILIKNKDAKSEDYDKLKDLYRPGHANYVYLEKYGIFDHRGAGPASGRETAARVAAAAVAKKILEKEGIETASFISQIGDEIMNEVSASALEVSPFGCVDPVFEKKARNVLEKTLEAKDSIGGVVSFVAQNMPVGLGEPKFNKLHASLAYAMMSIPGVKGFEIGKGFEFAEMKGSEAIDPFILDSEGYLTFEKNDAGGVLAGISNGMPLYGKVVFKPTSSIGTPIDTYNLDLQKTTFSYQSYHRHDPCIALRGRKVVEAMLILTLTDFVLMRD
ncbi:MAG TPA: chorismate synthase [Chlamydiales bacterium]|nr:chorismate synthase [Chlamydiales bacterium]